MAYLSRVVHTITPEGEYYGLMASSYIGHRWIAHDLTATKLEGRVRIHPQTTTTFPLLCWKMMAFALLPYVGWAGQPTWLYMAYLLHLHHKKKSSGLNFCAPFREDF